MKRSEFLAKTAALAVAGYTVPQWTPKLEIAEPAKPAKVMIDLQSISQIGKDVSAADILKMYHETGILIWDSSRGREPIIFKEIEIQKP